MSKLEFSDGRFYHGGCSVTSYQALACHPLSPLGMVSHL
jgi:hypothetical protein